MLAGTRPAADCRELPRPRGADAFCPGWWSRAATAAAQTAEKRGGQCYTIHWVHSCKTLQMGDHETWFQTANVPWVWHNHTAASIWQHATRHRAAVAALSIRPELMTSTPGRRSVGTPATGPHRAHVSSHWRGIMFISTRRSNARSLCLTWSLAGGGATMNKYLHSINNSMQPSLGFSLARYTDIFIDFKIVDTPAFYWFYYLRSCVGIKPTMNIFFIYRKYFCSTYIRKLCLV